MLVISVATLRGLDEFSRQAPVPLYGAVWIRLKCKFPV
jgi:hypothetical protein